ncbi:MAG: polysaccharide biosynthesis tyrosine autokinase, partial [Pyrinomonadaceae bacterium]|nr:polysaccharide biosynthesis tyrosine autokinase [Pyrinomonadaceae bacterium]
MSQDNRLMPFTPPAAGSIDRPLRDLTQPQTATGGTYLGIEPTHLRDYLSVVWKRKWLIFSLIVVVTTLVAIQMYRLPSIYEARTTIQIEPKARSLIKTKEVVINQGSDPAYWNTQLELLRSPRLARQVVLRLDLMNNPVFLGGESRTGLLTTARRVFSRGQVPAETTDVEGGLTVARDEAPSLEQGRMTPEQLARIESYENAFLANLDVEPVQKTNLVGIAFQHPNPELAQKIADTTALVFIDNDRSRETLGMDTTKTKQGEQLYELQSEIAVLEQQRLDYMKRNGIPLDKDMKGLNETADRLALTSNEALTAENEVKKLQASYDAARNTTDIFSIPEVQENKQIQTIRDRMSELQERRAALMVQYTERHPEVIKVDRQLQRQEEALDKRAVETKNGMGARLNAAKQRAGELSRQYATERGAATALSQKEITLNTINQKLVQTRELFNTLYQRKVETEMAGNASTDNILIQTAARTPELVGPPRIRNIIIAFLLSLGAGIGLAFLLDYLDDTLKSIEDVDRHVHLPTLALIPAQRSERRLSLSRAAAHDPAETTALALIEEARSPVAEAYRHLRTSLLLSSAGQPPKTILVTSSQPSEGKTTTAVNTAVMLAQTGADVLLLDCDLRRPRVHAHFNLPNARGVTNYLSGDTDLDGLMQTYDKLPNLKVITSGPVPPNSAELLGSEEMRRLLQQLSDEFTHIIIDSPPAISFTDASILSTMVDGVMLVVHGGRS